jgi:archaellum biogenesis ATPase FlaH
MITTELRPMTPPQPKAPAWLLPGLLPRGELVLLEGAASVGKSLLAAAFAARISHDDACTLLTASPSSSEILATHLARQQPQYEKVHELCWYADRDGKNDFAAEEALTKLQAHLEQHQPPVLVIDSLEESCTILAGEKEKKLREFWANLVTLARHHGTTILVLARPQGRRGTARVARTAAEAAKVVFALAYHPTDATIRVLTRTRDLTAPAGAQWHLSIDADGRLDWTEAGLADHVVPSSQVATWHQDVRNRPDLKAAVRAIEDALIGPTPPYILRDTVLRQGHTGNTYRTALSLVDAEFNKFGSVWVYTPGRELCLLQELRRRNSERSPQEEPTQPSRKTQLTTRPVAPAAEETATEPLSEEPDHPNIPQETEAQRRVEAKFQSVRDAFAEEFGPSALDEVFQSKGPATHAARFREMHRSMLATLTPDEREALTQMNQAYEAWETKKRQQQPACCARAHPATS